MSRGRSKMLKSKIRTRRGLTTAKTSQRLGWQAVPDWIQAFCTLGILGIATYAAFFSPFSSMVEAQLRSQVTSSEIENQKLGVDVQLLEAQRDALSQSVSALDAESVLLTDELSKNRVALLQLQRDIADVESAKRGLEASLRQTYEEQYLARLPGRWGQAKIPEAMVQVLNNWAQNEDPMDNVNFSEAYENAIAFLDELSIAPQTPLQSEAIRAIRGRFLENCPDERVFMAKFEEVLVQPDNTESVVEADPISQIFTSMRVLEQFCFGME